MLWLQRDFGVYLVNLFDTGQATRSLGFAGGFGLENLYNQLVWRMGGNNETQPKKLAEAENKMTPRSARGVLSGSKANEAEKQALQRPPRPSYDKKTLQKSDWSMRPLSKHQLDYAVSDTHYLLYAFYVLLEKLFEKDMEKRKQEELRHNPNKSKLRLKLWPNQNYKSKHQLQQKISMMA